MRRLTLTLSLLLAVAAAPAGAQNYPTKAVHIVVPYAPGGGVSVLAQLIGSKMSELMKQPVVIDNRPGAGGNVGVDAVAKAAPDGYTFLLHTSAMASAPALYKSLPFDPIKDFIPVTKVIATQFVVGGSPKNPAANLKELAAQAKANPGKLNYGSSGPGSSLHLEAEIFKHSAGVDMIHVPYRGDAPLMTALMSNDIQLAFLPQSTGTTNVQANNIRGLAVTGTKRMVGLPDVPTAKEQGFENLETGSWNGVFLPAGSPPEIVHALQQYIAKSLADPRVRERLMSVGQEPVGNPSEEFAAEYKAEIASYAKVVEQAKIPKLD
jgi:tripartite-type tricarboxylate transporter receptor subunit TctC